MTVQPANKQHSNAETSRIKEGGKRGYVHRAKVFPVTHMD